MTTSITITARFWTAERTDMGWSYWPTSEPARVVTLEMLTQQGLEQEVRLTVAKLGHHCAVSLQLPRGQRKPNGWDRFTRGLQFIACRPVAVSGD